MTRKQALADLIAKVEAGEWIANGGGKDTWLAIFDAGMQTYHAYIYEAWCRNSLDAAKALRVAVIPGHVPEMIYSDARKELICILKELITSERS